MLGLACQGAGAGGEVGELKVGTGGGLGKGHWRGFFLFRLKEGLCLARPPRALVLPMWLARQQALAQMCEIVPTPYRKQWFCKSAC